MSLFELEQRREVPEFATPTGDPDAMLPADLAGSPFLRATPDEREHVANVLRLRVAAALGTAMWSSFAVMDWLMCRFVYPSAPFGHVLIARFAVVPLYSSFFLLLRRKRVPTPRLLTAIDLLGFPAGSVSLALLSSLMGGIGGPYTPGVFFVIICRNAFLVQPWRRSVVPNVLIVIAHFATLVIMEIVRPGSVMTQGRTSSLNLLGLHLTSLLFGAMMLTAAGNTTWALRRRVFEARYLGRYRLLSPIAEGGHGEVWRAYHPGLRQEIAIKVMRSEISESEQALARFEREIDALCRLRHPHTIRILDYGVTTDGVCYYAMELLEGVTLAELVRTSGALEPARAIHLALQVAYALSEAHRHAIVHRDVKPENVFVLSSDAVPDFAKLLDFGIAKRHVASEPRVTGTGMVIGTPAFMAPEVAAGEPADPRADVYGVGALIHFMLTGRPPTGAAGARFERSVPPDLEHVMSRCLARNPDGRYPDAASIAVALSSLTDAYAWRPPTTASKTAPRPTEARPTLPGPKGE